MNNPAFSGFTSLALKVVGVILIISSIVDYIILAIPFNPLDQDWQISFTNQFVDRGIIPMVGIGFIVAGYWIGSAMSDGKGKISLSDLRFWSFLFASLLGLIFLLLVPLHLSNLNRARNQALQQIEQQVTQAESEIQSQFEQVNQLLQDNTRLEQLNQAIESGEVQGAQLEQLRTIRENITQLQGNPQALAERREEAQTQLAERRQEAEQRARTNALKSGIRIGVSSFLLAVGYIMLGWAGFRSLAQGNR
ncbi:MAG: hypothetical protein F6K03_10730 [Kamptonema sp. SIO4C4]|nr:hypothetical protein [Kamptonema sp. SIO4C4]